MGLRAVSCTNAITALDIESPMAELKNLVPKGTLVALVHTKGGSQLKSLNVTKR